MTNFPATHPASAARSSDSFAARATRPLLLGCAVASGLLALYVAWESAFGHLGYVSKYPLFAPEMLGPRLAGTVIILTGFMAGCHVYGRRELVRDFEALGPLLHCSPAELADLQREVESSDRRAGSWLGSLAAIPIGLLVVTSGRPGVPYLLSDDPWNHDLVWALACNALLFAILGRIAVLTLRTNELFARIEARLGPLDLVRPQALAPFAGKFAALLFAVDEGLGRHGGGGAPAAVLAI